MPDDPEDMARHLEEIATELRQLSVCGDWVDAYFAGEMLYTDEAAIICAMSAETVRRRCEGSAAANRPLGALLAGSVWIVSRSRLLDWIELHEGRPAMLAAKSRAEKLTEMRSSPQQSLRRRVKATG